MLTICSEASVKIFNDAVEEVLNELPDPKVYLKGLSSTTDVNAAIEHQELIVNLAASLRSVFLNMLSKSWTLAAEDENLISLYELLYAPAGQCFLTSLPEFDAFKTATADRLWHVLTAGLMKHFPKKDVENTLEAWRDNDPIKAWQTLELKTTASELETAAALGRSYGS
jgi:hypothetical protein